MKKFRYDDRYEKRKKIISAENINTVDEIRFKKTLKMIFQLCEVTGFELMGRITLVDKRSGKVWK